MRSTAGNQCSACESPIKTTVVRAVLSPKTHYVKTSKYVAAETVNGMALVIGNVDGTLLAYRDECPACGRSAPCPVHPQCRPGVARTLSGGAKPPKP